jgi:hypothetical protein
MKKMPAKINLKKLKAKKTHDALIAFGGSQPDLQDVPRRRNTN